MRRITNILAALSLVSAVHAASASELEHPPRLLLFTSLIDQSPSRAQLTKAGAGAQGQGLAAIVWDRSVSRYQRARAAAMLGFWPQSQPELQKIIGADALDTEIRIQAMGALVYAVKGRAWPALSRYFDSPNPALANAAARALLTVDDPTLQAKLTKNIERFSPGTQRAIQRRLEKRRGSASDRR